MFKSNFKMPPPSLAFIEKFSKDMDFYALQDPRPAILRRMTAEAPTTELYNRFFWELALKLQPELIVETGTDRGRSAGHFASGSPASRVITIDIDPVCTLNATELKFPNLVAVCLDSLEAASMFMDKQIDILFMDSLHTYEHTSAEYEKFLPKVASGGLIFIDDIHLDAGMELFWGEVTEQKIDISHLHYSGFGVILK